ncbi:mechanosensitive ion channel [Candidatus Fermentibacteria bacterium]|nr:mechanosensitive ion channel [Candidatus Fermentibacteria bacterium]
MVLDPNALLDFSLDGFPVGRGIAAALLLFLGYLVGTLVRRLLRGKPGRRTGFISVLLRDVSRPIGFLILVVAALTAVAVLHLSARATNVANDVLILLATIGVSWLLFKVIDAAAETLSYLTDKTESQLDDQLLPVLGKMAKILVAVLAIIFYMQILGYPVTGIVAGLGIGGIAVALAAQDTLSGVFASVTLFMDRPMMVGDFVKVGDVLGTVEEIGVRSTRIRTLGKTLITIPNKQLVSSVIDNWSLRDMRRSDVTIGVTYDTTPKKMEQLLAKLGEMLRQNENVDDSWMVVNFTTFSASSLDIELKFFLKTVDYNEWLNMVQEINLDIMRIVESLGLSFAFPSTSVYMEK